jgi:hypothetical protein
MNNLHPVIQQIELKIDDIYQDRSIASGFLDCPKEPDALDRYVQLQQDGKINSGVRYIALDVIAKKYQFYTSSAEKQKLTDIIGQSLTDCPLQQTFDDIQLLKSNYTDIYQADPTAFDRVDKILRNKLGLSPIVDNFPPSQPATKITQTPSVLLSTPPSPTTVSPVPKNNSKIVQIGMAIGAILIGMLSFLLGQKTNNNTGQIPANSINSPILSTPTPISTPNQISIANPPNTFIANYYTNINRRNYQLSWNDLTRHFQTKETSLEKGWVEYVKWWQSVARVDVDNTKIVSQSQDRAVVDVKLRYLMQSGRYTSGYLRFFLVNNSEGNNWLIDDVAHINSTKESNLNSSYVATENRQSSPAILSYQSHCTLLSAKSKQENIIDDVCNISQNQSRKNYILKWTNGEVSNIEFKNDKQAIINGETANVILKNNAGITIKFSRGKIGWDGMLC